MFRMSWGCGEMCSLIPGRTLLGYAAQGGDTSWRAIDTGRVFLSLRSSVGFSVLVMTFSFLPPHTSKTALVCHWGYAPAQRFLVSLTTTATQHAGSVTLFWLRALVPSGYKVVSRAQRLGRDNTSINVRIQSKIDGGPRHHILLSRLLYS